LLSGFTATQRKGSFAFPPPLRRSQGVRGRAPPCWQPLGSVAAQSLAARGLGGGKAPPGKGVGSLAPFTPNRLSPCKAGAFAGWAADLPGFGELRSPNPPPRGYPPVKGQSPATKGRRGEGAKGRRGEGAKGRRGEGGRRGFRG
jgi:hypothetical protein